ncbi:hypothetical protein EDD59_106147 [Muricomes intestini]|jgi:hypothetical protein|uniref:DUF6664 domain-containing protein n=2 Tax=Muricomes intestini TaxID=1796634 RepID=A0A4R3KCF9_9FIRM|nr:hypothetical protein EDD59_106147 [Muricomes intestini]
MIYYESSLKFGITIFSALDAQANLTMALGYNKPDDIPVTLPTIMQKIIDDIVDVYATGQHQEVMEELDKLYKRYPKVKDVVDIDKPHGLSEEKCVALICIYSLHNKLTAIEMQDVYFKGCRDCVGYLKRINML